MDKALEKMREKWLTWAGLKIIVFWIVGSWVVYGILVGILFRSWPSQGLFGDMYGGLNSLFSGLAFAGVIITILLQSKELQEQRKEFELQREAQQDSAKALERQAEILKSTAKLNSITAFVGNWEEISIAIGTEKRNIPIKIQQNQQAGMNEQEAEEKGAQRDLELTKLHDDLQSLRNNALVNFRNYLEI